jgi:hypothetical protein
VHQAGDTIAGYLAHGYMKPKTAIVKLAMRDFRTAAGLTSFLCTALLGMPAQATFHLWEIAEIYTNYDGSVQFIELATSFNSQHLVSGHEIQATSDGNIRTFTFNSNLSSSSTQGKTLLIATPGFGGLAGGVAPDYSLPDGPFFDPAAASITITFVGADAVTFNGSLLPTDGVNSLYATPGGLLSTDTNSPQNFAGNDGMVNLPPPATDGDYNGDGTVDAGDYIEWRKNDGTQAGYDAWRANFGATAGGGSAVGASQAAPEPASLSILFVAAICGSIRRLRACLRISQPRA